MMISQLDAVIACENDDRVFILAGLFEQSDDFADIVVDLCHQPVVSRPHLAA